MNQPVRSTLRLVVTLLAAASSLLAAPPEKWTARIRGTYLDMANKSDAFTALGTNFAGGAVRVDSKWIPEIDFTYAFTEHLRAELVLTVPQKQEVTLAGVGKLGSFKHLPPTLLAQYHFAPGATFQPYVGAGANFTLIFKENLRVATVPLGLENFSIGAAAQAGCDIALGGRTYLNLDVKRAVLRSDVSVLGGPRLTTAKLDPWLLSIGFGCRF